MPARRRGAPGSFGAPLQEIVPRFPAAAVKKLNEERDVKSPGRSASKIKRDAPFMLNDSLAKPRAKPRD